MTNDISHNTVRLIRTHQPCAPVMANYSCSSMNIAKEQEVLYRGTGGWHSWRLLYNRCAQYGQA